MERKTKIVIDTKGGDNGASVIVKGASLALGRFPQLDVVLVGSRDQIASECELQHVPMDRAEIIDAPGEITNFDNPADALYHKTDSSMPPLCGRNAHRHNVPDLKLPLLRKLYNRL